MDRSNGWEAIADDFIAERERSTIGVDGLTRWSRGLPAGAAVLDLGCGPGGPRSRVLAAGGFALFAVDASPRLAASYARAFPRAKVACEAAEDTTFFARGFDAIVAWGLLFLLPGEAQLRLIERAAGALLPGGHLLFTAPWQVHTWADLSTGRESRSLGAEVYRAAIADAGLILVGEFDDEGGNHYYDAIRG